MIFLPNCRWEGLTGPEIGGLQPGRRFEQNYEVTDDWSTDYVGHFILKMCLSITTTTTTHESNTIFTLPSVGCTVMKKRYLHQKRLIAACKG